MNKTAKINVSKKACKDITSKNHLCKIFKIIAIYLYKHIIFYYEFLSQKVSKHEIARRTEKYFGQFSFSNNSLNEFFNYF